MLRGDCEALPTGARSPLRAFHVRFPFGKRLTVNVFRQRMNQLFQGGGDIWRGIALHSLRDHGYRTNNETPLPRVVIRWGLTDSKRNSLEDEERTWPSWFNIDELKKVT
ncbi:hypothetical protein [Cylindrospermopsis raciborskii]|uniref:hypothetical protein n=1 Tax=Cylindrospermopsis raciborskii TaxID=77022 RepID=UPI003DA4D57E